MLDLWKSLPQSFRRGVRLLVKLLLTVGAFYLLLTHSITTDGGGQTTIWQAISEHVRTMELSALVPWLLVAALIKALGILSSMLRWHLLLIGQGIRFNFGHLVGSFLIGRFLGTFLPSTVGLDSYKLYDAARFSDRVVEPAAATVVEKVMGLSGIFLTFLVTFPLGYGVLGDSASLVAQLTVPIALGVIGLMFALLFRPGMVEWVLGILPGFGRGRIEGFISRLSKAAVAYRGRGRILLACFGLSFLVHFTTAAMYFFTALAVGAQMAEFWEVSFASSIQIFATVISPFTIAGEGVREIVQALLLAKHIGTTNSILSAALGFWAAEALTLVGGVFWWLRKADYRPRFMSLTVADSAAVTEASAG